MMKSLPLKVFLVFVVVWGILTAPLSATTSFTTTGVGFSTTSTSTTRTTTVTQQNGLSTMPPPNNGIILSVSPPSSIVDGTRPTNLTCTFQHLPVTNNIFMSISSGYGRVNIVQVSTQMMAAAMTADLQLRMAVFLLDDGVSLQFQYRYMTAADSGTYQCYVAGTSMSSNVLSLTVVGNGQWSNVTPGGIPQFTNDYSGSDNGGLNVPLIIAVSIGVACLLVTTVLLILRLKYRDRFIRFTRSRRQRPPTYENATASGAAGINNPVYVVDPEQLPSYNDAVKIADAKVFMPPNYFDVVNGGGVEAPTASVNVGVGEATGVETPTTVNLSETTVHASAPPNEQTV